MKRTIILAASLLLLSATLIAQISGESAWSKSFWLHNTTIKISNSFMQDDNGIRLSPHYLPVTENRFRFIVYGPTTGVLISESANHHLRSGNSGGRMIDSLHEHKDLFHLQDLETRTLGSDGRNTDWIAVKQLPIAIDSNSTNAHTAKPYRSKSGEGEKIFLAASINMKPGDSAIVEFRSITNKVNISLILSRKSISPFPYLAVTIEDPGKSTAVDLNKNFTSDSMSWMISSQFYRYWPGKGTELKNKMRPADSRMILIFREPDNSADAKPFEYRFEQQGNLDSAWIASGNMIMTPLLKPGTNMLRVRYKGAPGFINEYSFDVPLLWYQTNVFRISAVVIACLLLLGIIALYYLRLLKHKNEKRRMEMQVLYSQLNPHFVFNAMSSIQGLMNNNEFEKANIYISSQLISGSCSLQSQDSKTNDVMLN